MKWLKYNLNKRGFLFLLFLIPPFFAYVEDAPRQILSKQLNGFIENKGQIIDQHNKLNPAVLYLLNTPGMNVQLRRAGFSYDVYSVSSHQFAVRSSQSLSGIQHPASDIQHPVSSIQYHRIDFDLLNTNVDCKIITSEPSADYLNYYTTGTPIAGATYVHYYKTLTYKNIYPNIDLVFMNNDIEGFKYNFIIHPGGNLNDIRIKIRDPEIKLLSSGSLLLKTSLGDIEETIPRSYYMINNVNSIIHSRFREISKFVYGFSLEDDLPQNSTIIVDPDPTRIWGTYYGGLGDEGAWGCSTDGAGNVFISGNTESLTFIATSGAHQSTYGGGLSDTFLAKFSAEGQRLWGTYYGGSSGEDGCASCPVDKAGNVYICGRTLSTNNISTPGSFQPVTGGWEDGFLVKFNTNGQRLWGTYYGGSDVDRAYDCSTDDSCNIYLAGGTGSPNSISTPGAYQETFSGGLYDGFLVKFDSSGQRIWGTYYGGTSIEEIESVSVNTNHHVLFTGSTYSTDNIASPGSFQETLAGADDVFLVLFNSDGQRLWGTYYGGNNNDEPRKCKLSNDDKIFLFGGTLSINNISTPGSQQPVKSGDWDTFLVKFNLNGNREWGTYYGGDSLDGAFNGLAVNDSGYIYIAGETNSPNNIATPGSFMSTFQGGDNDAFIAKFNENGQRIWGTYFGGPLRDWGGSLALDSCDVLYLSGSTQSDTNIATPGAHQTTNNGGSGNWGDGYLIKFSDCHVPDTAQQINGPFNVCKNSNNIVYFIPPIANAATYLWTIPPGVTIISGQNTNSIILDFGSSASSGKITVYGINCCGNGVNSSLDITVHSRPIPLITGNDTSCTGQSYSYSTSPGKSLYQWNVSMGGSIIAGGSSSDYAATVIWNTPGDQWMEVNYTDTNGCSALIPAHKNVWVNQSTSVSISVAIPNDTLCIGVLAVFTATTVNGGSNPVYAWFLNGLEVGSNNPVYSYIPVNGDCMNCKLFSSITCADPDPAISDTICLTVTPILTVSITIAPSVNPACLGNSVTFTSIPQNGGLSPVFQWRVNGINAGSNSPVFSYFLSNADTVTCMLTSSLTSCISNNQASSNQVIMIIDSNLVVGITITASANPVCAGTSVTFTATPTNGGLLPVYQWKVNGVNAGSNSPTYTYNPASGDIVTCILTSSLPCTSSNPASSNPVSVLINPPPVVTFTACFDTITTVNAKPFKLKGGIPLGGTYSGPGVTPATGIFNPATAGNGLKTITYSYTNVALCSSNAHTHIFNFQFSIFNCGTPLTDIRDNQVYQTVQIGAQCWMAENLSYGTEIPDNLVQRDNCIAEKYRDALHVTRDAHYQWDELMQYDDSPALQGLCPPAWHVPTEAEWQTLFSFYNGSGFAGSPLLSTGFSGFNALVNGSRFQNSSWNFDNFAIHLWSSSAWGPLKAWAHAMNNAPDNHSVSTYPSSRSNAFSVRCIKD